MRATGRRAALATLLCLLGFAGSWLGAMALYPGGTWLDPTQMGQSFFGNFFCDLAQPTSLSGVPNPVGSRLAQGAMLLFAGALAGLFWVVPQHFAPTLRARAGVRAMGTLSVLVFIAVPLTPSERFGNFHAALALLASALGMLAALVAVRALLISPGRARALGVLGALGLAVGAFAAAVFVWHLRDVGPPPLLVPAAQKVAAMLISLWIAGVAGATLLDKDSSRA